MSSRRLVEQYLRKYYLHGGNCCLVALLLSQGMPKLIVPAIGNLRTRYGTIRDALSAAFAISFALKDVSGRKKTISLKPIYFIAKAVVYVRGSAGRRL